MNYLMNDESYYDDEENDEYYNDNYQDDEYDNTDINKLYFKFDVSSSPLSDWITNLLGDMYNIQNIPGFPFVSLPVNSYFSNTDNGFNSILYLGNNYQNQPIWKTKYFVKNSLEIEYKNHIKQYPSYFVKQPVYYKGLFDILN